MFTEEEKTKIDKAIETIVRDMLKIREESTLEKIDFTFTKTYDYKSLFFQKQPIIITKDLVQIGSGIILYQNERICFSRNSEEMDEFYEKDLRIIESYPEMRKQIMENVKNKVSAQKRNIALCDDIINFIKGESYVVIDFPDTLNQHTISLEEQNGQKIGIINFGNQTIKIITSGEIEVIKNQESNQKQKKY